jgi:hypothetical protein
MTVCDLDQPLAARPEPHIVPRYFSRTQAAHYLGVSATTFQHEVNVGMWPPGRRRGLRNGRVTWDRKLLDLWADRDSGIDSGTLQSGALGIEEEIALERSTAAVPQKLQRGRRPKVSSDVADTVRTN